jgi:hypothetical protein
MKEQHFRTLAFIAVDFMATDITNVHFDNCDLYQPEFDIKQPQIKLTLEQQNI